MTDDDLADRLAAVERRLNAAYPEPQDGIDEERVESMAERLADVEAAVEAIEGYVGAIEREDEELERRADAALAATDDLEERVEDLEARVGEPRERATTANRQVAGATDRTPDERAVADGAERRDEAAVATGATHATASEPAANDVAATVPAANDAADSWRGQSRHGGANDGWGADDGEPGQHGTPVDDAPRTSEPCGDGGRRLDDAVTPASAALGDRSATATDESRAGSDPTPQPVWNPKPAERGDAERCSAAERVPPGRRPPERDDPVSGWGPRAAADATAAGEPGSGVDGARQATDGASSDAWTAETDDDPGRTLFERLRDLL